MATVIRFSRHGTKKKPYYRMVVQDGRSPRDGRFIERIGSYDPIKGAASLVVARDRLEYWLSTGAQMSLSVENRVKLKKKEWAKAPAETVATPAPAKKSSHKASKEA